MCMLQASWILWSINDNEYNYGWANRLKKKNLNYRSVRLDSVLKWTGSRHKPNWSTYKEEEHNNNLNFKISDSSVCVPKLCHFLNHWIASSLNGEGKKKPLIATNINKMFVSVSDYRILKQETSPSGLGNQAWVHQFRSPSSKLNQQIRHYLVDNCPESHWWRNHCSWFTLRDSKQILQLAWVPLCRIQCCHRMKMDDEFEQPKDKVLVLMKAS